MVGKPPPKYVGNPKHKRGRNRGRRGSYCPGEIDTSKAQKLLDVSVSAAGSERKRFATDGTMAFCAHCHNDVMNEWHGHPVEWYEVPPRICAQWIEAGITKAKVVRGRSGRS